MKGPEVYAFDLQQDDSLTDLDVSINRPVVVIQDRHYLEGGLEIDLGHIKISNTELVEAGRFKKAPKKEVGLNQMNIEARDLGITFLKDGFAVSEPFDLTFSYSYLKYSKLLPYVDSDQLDKSFRIKLQFSPLKLRFKQEIYTYLLRCVDLNFAWTDYNEKYFDFRLEEEYFKSKAELLRQRISIEAPKIIFYLFEEQGSLLTEMKVAKPVINLDWFLNRKQTYAIGMQDLLMFYLKDNEDKMLLIGPMS